jgi:FixJ family two-component response regulator
MNRSVTLSRDFCNPPGLGNSRYRIPVIFITAREDPMARAQAVKAGAIDFLQKPFACDTLLGAIQAALHTRGDI